MTKTLVIVESPNKIKKLQACLGPGYLVKASVGHIRQLNSLKDIDFNNNYQPNYSIDPKKLSVVKGLRDALKACNGKVLIATDPDREGEAIGWHIAKILNVDLTKANRISFREITQNAVVNATKKPTKLDLSLFYAQQSRAVLDLLIGFELSSLVSRYFGRGAQMSAGRVQSVVNKLIIDRENDIRDFSSSTYYLVKGQLKHRPSFNPENKDVELESNELIFLDCLLDRHITWKSNKEWCKLRDEGDDTFNEDQYAEDKQFNSMQEKMQDYLNKCNVSKFKLKTIERKDTVNKPFPPYTTSSLQQDANRFLGLGAKACMNYAQKLYEMGHITYHRTDSVTLSEVILAKIKDYVTDRWGQEYLNIRRYKTKDASAQEAHEAIRPTQIEKENPGIDDPMALRLYQLIWRRTLASQMANQIVDTLTLHILICKTKHYFVSRMTETKFDGWKVLFNYKSEDEDEDEKISEGGASGGGKKMSIKKLVKRLQTNDVFKYVEINAEEKYTTSKARYTEGDLVKKLKTLGIGRPSTYANMVSKVLDRQYAIKETRKGDTKEVVNFCLHKKEITSDKGKFTFPAERNKLFPTPLGEKVNTFLDDKFSEIINYKFTAEMEKSLDKVADNKLTWYKTVDKYYNVFHPIVETTKEALKTEGGVGKRQVKAGVYVAHGKYGPYCQVGEDDDKGKKYIKLPKNCDVDNITWEQIQAIPVYPKSLGKRGGKDVMLCEGPHGFYLKFNGTNVAIKREKFGRGFKPEDITLEQADSCISEKMSNQPTLICKSKGGFEVMNGQYGWYTKYKGKFVSLPKDYQNDKNAVMELDEATVKDIQRTNAENRAKFSKATKGGGFAGKKKFTKK